MQNELVTMMTLQTRLGLFGWVCVGSLLAACASDSADVAGGTSVMPENPGDNGGKTPGQGSGGQGGGFVGGGTAGGQGVPPGQGAAGGKAGPEQGQGGAGDEASGGAGGQAGSAAGGEGGSSGQVALCKGVDLEKPTTLYVSADDSNSMASPALARGLLRRGQAPTPWLIRPYEFLNYYNVAYEAPEAGGLRVVPQMRPGKTKGDYELQIGVQSAPVERRPYNLTFVLDTSGSMQGEPVARMKAAMRAIASQLQEGDVVSMTTWSTTTNIVLSGHAVQGPDDGPLASAIEQLSANGGTDLHLGLVNGYDLARQHYSEERVNRVVVISDGVANVGVTDELMIGKETDLENKEGIYLVGVGVGDGVNDTLLNVVTDAGNGAYLYLDSEDEAQRMLTGRFDEVIGIAARNVQVALTMPSYFSIVKFSGEQYSTDPAKVKPQHLAPGDAMVISQTVRACDPSLVVASDPLSLKVTWTEPGSWKARQVEVATTVGELGEAADAQLRRGRAIVAYADALKKGSECIKRGPLVSEALAAADAADPGKQDESLNEIRELVTTFGELCP